LIWAHLRRGLAAGLLAGIFAFVFAEPILDQTIDLENVAHEHSGEVFDRGAQKAGLMNPPGVGADPTTLTERTLAYLPMVALGTLDVLAAWRFARELEGASLLVRDPTAGGILVGLWAFLHLAMPDFGVAVGQVPAELAWNFRLSSLGTQAVLWAGSGCIFGLLGERASRRNTL
jgi:Probable cobalt transporter subunit (CbtA)